VALLFHRQALRGSELTVAVDVCLATAVIELDDIRKRSGTAVEEIQVPSARCSAMTASCRSRYRKDDALPEHVPAPGLQARVQGPSITDSDPGLSEISKALRASSAKAGLLAATPVL
jgi:hypothetical protein